MGQSRTGGNQAAGCRSQTSSTTSSVLILSHRGFSSIDIGGEISPLSQRSLPVGTYKCPPPSLRVGMSFFHRVVLALGLQSPQPLVGAKEWSF